MSEWIKCGELMPAPHRPVIVYGNQMSSHWPDVAYAKWNPSENCWRNCFAYGGEDWIRPEEVDYWLDIELPKGCHD